MGIASWGDATSPFCFTGRAPIQRNDTDPTVASYTAGHLGFHGYMRAVDALFVRWTGLGVFDFPDRYWRDAYDDESPPKEAVTDCLKDEGWPDR